MTKYVIRCELLHISYNKVNTTMLYLTTCHQVVKKLDFSKKKNSIRSNDEIYTE